MDKPTYELGEPNPRGCHIVRGDYTSTYTIWSGSSFDPDHITGLTWNLTRQAAPVFTMNSPNPREFKRGKRDYVGKFSTPHAYKLGEVIDQITINYEHDMGSYVTRTLYNVRVLKEVGDGDEYIFEYIADELGPALPKEPEL